MEFNIPGPIPYPVTLRRPEANWRFGRWSIITRLGQTPVDLFISIDLISLRAASERLPVLGNDHRVYERLSCSTSPKTYNV
ncbi:Hypothetical protein NTJ_00391 [Nesidiocoris tenuis]|uniref:Uncharacterized protein n=1 Tax=Nesidiocoris tenuis TaxID=355587 RepID=A0ABN7A9M5_9HEMI|nr:Hypothetical protein NTJ_00391 [Nesidiocoris tenuis]